MEPFTRLESEVRSYSRSWPTVFDTAHGSTLVDEEGREYVDFFSGAGALNYGHNPMELRRELVEYLARGGVTHSLDTATRAKREFLLAFEELILQPRGLDYKLMFPGPTGTNAIESALKLARKVTGRETVVAFTNAFHGMTLGSLALTGNGMKRAGAGVPLHHAVSMPFEGSLDDVDTLDQFRFFLENEGSGLELPAAVVVETIQAEGGVNVASGAWMRRLQGICREYGILLVVDDIQVGCGRTGPFFSFEEMDLEFQPDIICLSKSLSGYGLPFAVVLLDPRWDVWTPGEHNGTFRGFNLAFVTATAALRHWWSDDTLSEDVARRSGLVSERLSRLVSDHPGVFHQNRGRGLIQGIECTKAELADAIVAKAFQLGLVVETAGPDGEVVKLLPALTISDQELELGLSRLAEAVETLVTEEGDALLDQPVAAAD